VALVAHDDVVQAVSAESADHSFTEGVRLRCSRRCGQQTRTEPSNAGTELAAVDGVSVVDDKVRVSVSALFEGDASAVVEAFPVSRSRTL
jgi:hypothetical protein